MPSINTKKDIGLLVIRATIGLTMLAFHGLPKITKGPAGWEKIGLSMSSLGVNFTPVFWGFSAALVETVGALFIIIGLWTRPSSILLGFTMLIAAISHLMKGDGLQGASHAIELLAVFIGLFLLGPGKYSVDKK